MEKPEMENELHSAFFGKHLKVIKVFQDDTFLAIPL